MTKAQTILLEMSRNRQRLNDLLGKDTKTEDEVSEMDTLVTRQQALEVEHRAAIVVEPDGTVTTHEVDNQERERRALVDDSNMGRIFDAILDHRSVDGRERELQAAYGLAANQVPLAALETRAVTPAPSNVGQNQSEIIPGVFPQSAAAFIGVDMPTVAVGEAVYPVLTTSATVHTPAENATANDTTGAFSAEVLSPARLQASFFYSREDRARFTGMDEALRMNLNDALSDGLDNQIISGTNGLLNGTVLANHNVTAATSFDLYLAGLVYGRVDGKYASTSADIKLLLGAHTYGHAGRVYRNNSVDRTALDRLMEVTAGVRVSAHVPAAGSNRQNALIRLGMRRDMVAPIWEGITLIPDEVTKAASGQIVVTAVMLHAVKLLRSAGFYKQQTQSA